MSKTVNHSDPYRKVSWRGHTFDNRTKSALIWAEKRYMRRGIGRVPFRIGQGSFASGSKSAGTHEGGGAADIMFGGVSPRHRKAIVKWLKKAGFAAWAREGAAWGVNNDHCHVVLRGHRTASPEAKAQVVSYDNHRDGLAGDNYDPTWRPKPPIRWSHRMNRPYRKK